MLCKKPMGGWTLLVFALLALGITSAIQASHAQGTVGPGHFAKVGGRVPASKAR